MFKVFAGPLILINMAMPFFAALPSTTNYSLNSYGFGSGGGSQSTTNYAVQGISGEVSGNTASTSNYALKPGFIQTEQANVPKMTLTNPSSYYDKLKFVIDTQNNPSDALYALQVKVNDAACNFTTGTIMYVQPSDTLTSSLVTADYQTYTSWGGASGQNMIGLSPSTNYCIRAKATQGKYTESAYGPSSAAVPTIGQTLSFCLYTGANCATGGSSISLSLTSGSITTSGNINVDFATNADFGGSVYVYSLNGGLTSVSSGGSITSATANLAVATQGFGAQVTAATQSTGGAFTSASPFNGSANNVGVLANTVASIFTSSNPLTGGNGTFQLQAKPTATTPEATDYSEKLTLIAAASF